MTLAFVTAEEVAQTSATISVLLYGPHGTSKSTAACGAPDPNLYVNTDRRAGLRYGRLKHKKKDIREQFIGRDDPCREVMEQAYLYAADATNGVKTVTLDSLGRIYDLVLADIARDDKHPTLPERGDASTFIERYVLALLELPVHVVLIAHDHEVIVGGSEEDGTGRYETFPFTGTGNTKPGKKLMRSVDIVGYTGRIEPEKEGEEPRYVAQLYPAGGRQGKDGTSVLGDVADLDLAGWANLVSRAFSANGKKNSKEEK